VIKLLRNIHLWFVAILFILPGLLVYSERVGLELLSGFHFGLFIAFLLPVFYAVFVFGPVAGYITAAAALFASLPRAVAFTATMADSVALVIGVFLTGILISILFQTVLREKQNVKRKLEQNAEANRLLQQNLDNMKASEKRLALFNAISATLYSSLELKSLYQKSTHLVAELMSVEIVLMFIRSTDRLSLVASEGISDQLAESLQTFRVGEGIYGGAAKDGRSTIVEDATSDPRLNTEEFRRMRIMYQIVVPLTTKNEVYGVMCVATRRPRHFTSYDSDILKNVAVQVAAAIDNARLYEEQRETARRLALSEGNYRRLLEHASDAIFAHDLDGRIVAANRAASELTGFADPRDLIGHDVREFLDWKGLGLARRVRQKLLDKEEMQQPYEQRLIRKDGSEIIVMISTSLIVQEGSPPVFEHISRDVTRERRLQDNLRHYVQQITKTQEEERNRIARDLHDETAQALYALTRQVDNYIRVTGSQLPPETNTFLKNLEEQIRNALQGVRRFSQDLRPPMLDDLGLLAALRWLVRDLQNRCGMQASLIVNGVERRLASHSELTVFRVVQEALRNVEKHSAANNLTVNVTFDADSITVVIDDDGKGFALSGDFTDLPRGGRLGLVGMDERVRLLGGKFNIHSEVGKGTSVFIQVPA